MPYTENSYKQKRLRDDEKALYWRITTGCVRFLMPSSWKVQQDRSENYFGYIKIRPNEEYSQE